jgi:hypothetical protein
MATRKPKKAAPKKATAKKAPAKKAAKKKAAKKKAAKKKAAPKKKAAKKAAPKKAASKKAASKKAAPKKAAKKKAAKAAPKKSAQKKAKKKAPAKTSAKRPRPEREARRAKPDLPRREETDLAEIEEADVIAIEEESERENGVATQRRKRPKTSLPPDHEVLDPGPLRGEPVDKGTVIEAIRAAFKADEEHPVRGREFLGARSPVDVPQEGEVDYARAVEAQKAAAEVLARAEMAGEEQKAVDERIAEVYSSIARDFSDE